MNDQRQTALIMTVGLPGDQGGDIVEALSLDLKELQPTRLVLIASSQSRPNAERILERSSLPRESAQVIELVSAHDLDEIFQKMNAVVQRLIAEGFSADSIAINYTSGTKIMGSGAVLSAVYNRIKELRYITGLGAPRESGRRHRILTTHPAAVFSYQNVLSSLSMMRELRFLSARRVLESVDHSTLPPDDVELYLQLSTLARAYDEWENFNPDRFLEYYGKVRFEKELLRVFRLNDDALAAVEALVAERASQQPGPHIITDMFNNAARRLVSGRNEDAFARLYRALEMLAQWVLMRDFGLDTNDLDTRRIPPRDRVGYEALRSLDDGMVKIGMRKAFDLLVIFNTRVGQRFQQDTLMRALLEKRSNSILAHGFTTADAELATDFLRRTRELLRVEIEDFDELSRRLQYPWILHRLPE